MAQQGNDDRGDRDLGGGPSDEERRRRDEGDRRSAPLPSFSPRHEQMGGYFTGADRNYGGGQWNYGDSSPDDWGGSSQGGLDWGNAPDASGASDPGDSNSGGAPDSGSTSSSPKSK